MEAKIMASILFEKATGKSTPESFQLIDKLASESRLGKKEAIMEAIIWLMQGLRLIGKD